MLYYFLFPSLEVWWYRMHALLLMGFYVCRGTTCSCASFVAFVLRPRYEEAGTNTWWCVADFLRPEWNGTRRESGVRIEDQQVIAPCSVSCQATHTHTHTVSDNKFGSMHACSNVLED